MTPERLQHIESQLEPRAWLALFVTVVAMTALAGFLYGLKPALAELEELSSGEIVTDLEQTRALIASNDDTILILETQKQELEAQLYGASAQLPPEKMEAWVIGSLDRISRGHGIQLLSVEPGRSSQVLMFEEMPYEVNVAGSYFALYEWLDSVEKQLRPMIVKQFEMDRSGGDDRVRMRLRLAAYRAAGESA